MDEFARHEYTGRPIAGDTAVVAERRKLNWSAIVAGVVATLGLQCLVMFLGSALGLSAFDPVETLRSESSTGVSVAMILFLAISTLASLFFGSWIAGHWANLFESEDALMHGALTWALSIVAMTMGLGGLAQIAGQATQAGALARANMPGSEKNQGLGTYSVLNDDRFAAMVASRARNWNNARDPINVSTDSKQDASAKVDPDDIVSDAELQSFVMANGNMTEDRAKEFLKANKDSIAKAQADSKKQYEQLHAKELAIADKLRKGASTMAWTLTGLALLGLGASLAGSYLGWQQHYGRVHRGDLPSEESAGNRSL